jgi:hypothetical protein
MLACWCRCVPSWTDLDLETTVLMPARALRALTRASTVSTTLLASCSSLPPWQADGPCPSLELVERASSSAGGDGDWPTSWSELLGTSSSWASSGMLSTHMCAAWQRSCTPSSPAMPSAT